MGPFCFKCSRLLFTFVFLHSFFSKMLLKIFYFISIWRIGMWACAHTCRCSEKSEMLDFLELELQAGGRALSHHSSPSQDPTLIIAQ